MKHDIDLRGHPAAEHRDRLFTALDESGTGDDLDIMADRDIDPHLVRYQLDRNRSLIWAYAHPDADPRELELTVDEPLEDDTLPTIDVRDLKPQRRHQVLLELFDELSADEGVVLVNDHDPKPLYHELRSMHGDVIEWEYRRRESDEWRVAILKTEDSEAEDDGVVTRYDVREIPKEERHPTIHHRYGMIPEGGTMEIVAPHEPRPLHREFRQKYGDAFTWDVIEAEPGQCRVQITKAQAAGSADTGEGAPAPSDVQSIEVIDELDVRNLPPAQRHERIFDAYDKLATGEGFVLVNDHDPKPLYHQFEAEAGPEFHWTYRLREPGEFKVLIAKAEGPREGMADEEPDAPF